MRVKSFKQKNDELKASRLDINDINNVRTEDLYSVSDKAIKKKNKISSIGKFHLNKVFLVPLVLIHIVAFILNIVSGTAGMVMPLLIGLVLLITSNLLIKVNFERDLNERINHHVITTKSVLNYFPFFHYLYTKEKLIHFIFLIIIVFSPFLIIWNNFTIVFTFIYLIGFILWALHLIPLYYEQQYTLLENKIASFLSFLCIGIFIFSISADTMYVVSLLMYIIFLSLFKFIRPFAERKMNYQ